MADGKLNKHNVSDEQSLAHPDIKAWVTIPHDGTEITASDERGDKLADTLSKLNNISQDIANNFGISSTPDEIHIVCDNITAVCMTGKLETVGVLFDKNTKPNEFLAKYKTPKSWTSKSP